MIAAATKRVITYIIPKISLIAVLCFAIFVTLTPFVLAQSASQATGSLGVAKMVEVSNKDIQDGSVLSSSSKGNVPSAIPYDPQVIGIVARDAAIILNTAATENSVPVIAEGTVYVLVSSKNGPIKKDDLLTTSTIPGIAVKAVKDGYVIGNALEDYTSGDPKQVGKIAVNLNLHYFNAKPTLAGTLTDIFKLALLPTKDGPAPIFKYVVAALVVIGSFVLGFMSFARTAAKGVEALGRNPAASRVIHLGIIFNVFIVIVIVLAGLTVAFLILRL